MSEPAWVASVSPTLMVTLKTGDAPVTRVSTPVAALIAAGTLVAGDEVVVEVLDGRAYLMHKVTPP